MRTQGSSDPLPYVEVDRSAHAKAAQLADAIDVSRQHALGSLVEFWSICGEPRELERIVQATPDGEEPAVVFDEEGVRERFKIASGRDVSIKVLEIIRIVAKHPGGWRVRGMSRFFNPVAKRLQARDAASKGGKASAERRAKEHGSAQPRVRASLPERLKVAQAPPEPELEAAPKRARSGSEAESNPSGQRSADSGQLLGEEAPPALPPPPRRVHIVEGDLPDGEAFFDWCQVDVREKRLGLVRERRKQSSEDLEMWFRTAALAVNGDIQRLQRGYERFSIEPYWREKGAPWPGWLEQWESFVPAKSPDLVQRADVVVFRELVQHLRSVCTGEPSYVLAQLGECAWRRDGDTFVGETKDPYFAEWCRDHYAFPQVEVRVLEAA